MGMPHKMDFLHRFLSWEHAIVEFANRLHRRHLASRFFGIVSRLGDGIGWYSLMAALLLYYGWAVLPAIAQMLVTAGVGVALYGWIKRRTARPRPCESNERLQLSVAPLDQYSFPSGHTLHAVAFSVLMIHHFPELAWLVLPFAVLVMASRLVLGLHYLTDVLAGAALGLSLALVSLQVGSYFIG